jgi:hypothetical protein
MEIFEKELAKGAEGMPEHIRRGLQEIGENQNPRFRVLRLIYQQEPRAKTRK